MPASQLEHARRTAAKRFNACVLLAAATFNGLVLTVLVATVLVPILQTNDPSAALTPFNGIVAAWAVVLQAFGYAMVRFARGG